jgi:hypothetical protein
MENFLYKSCRELLDLSTLQINLDSGQRGGLDLDYTLQDLKQGETCGYGKLLMRGTTSVLKERRFGIIFEVDLAPVDSKLDLFQRIDPYLKMKNSP